MKKGLLIAVVTLITLMSTISAAFACAWHFYEPELPAELKEQ